MALVLTVSKNTNLILLKQFSSYSFLEECLLYFAADYSKR